MKILEEQKAENILVVTHGFSLRIIVGYVIFGNDFNSYDFVRMKDSMLTNNTGITVIQIGKIKKWQLTTWNDHAHLLD